MRATLVKGFGHGRFRWVAGGLVHPGAGPTGRAAAHRRDRHPDDRCRALLGFAVALAVFLGFVANLTPAARLSWRLGLGAVATTALTGAVATALLGQPVPAACFAALACLVAAPGNIWHNNLLGAIPTVVAVYTTLLIDADPRENLGGLLIGGAVAVGAGWPGVPDPGTWPGCRSGSRGGMRRRWRSPSAWSCT